MTAKGLAAALAALFAAVSSFAAPVTAASGPELGWKRDGKKLVSRRLPVDTARDYVLTGEFTAEKNVKDFTFGLDLYDRNGRAIYPHEVRAVPGTGTRTMRPAKKGDRMLYVEDAADWNIRAARILALGARSDLSDLPARDIAYYVTKKTRVGDGWELEFSRPLPRDIAAGTPVRLHGDGAHAIVAAYKSDLAGGRPRRFRHFISAGAKYTSDSTVWWPQVCYARIYVQVPENAHVRAGKIALRPATPEERSELLRERELAGAPPRAFGKYVPTGNGTEILVQPLGGFYLDRLNFSTAETRQIEMRIKTDVPGMVELVWAGRDAKGWKFSGKRWHLLIPDRDFHWYVFPTTPGRDASGAITNLQMKFLGDVPAKLDMTSINARTRENLIPGARHIFSTLPALPVEVLRQLAARAGVRFYTPDTGDPVWVGNDVIFLHAATGGEKSVILPPGTRMRGLIGPHKGEVFRSGAKWDAEAGSTHGFLVYKDDNRSK